LDKGKNADLSALVMPLTAYSYNVLRRYAVNGTFR
jgi:hypothetical protein